MVLLLFLSYIHIMLCSFVGATLEWKFHESKGYVPGRKKNIWYQLRVLVIEIQILKRTICGILFLPILVSHSQWYLIIHFSLFYLPFFFKDILFFNVKILKSSEDIRYQLLSLELVINIDPD